MVSKMSNSVATYARPSSPPTLSVIDKCKIKVENRRIYKLHVESVVKQYSNPIATNEDDYYKKITKKAE